MFNLIDSLAYNNRSQKKTSDIDSRIVWLSFDKCKDMNYSNSCKVFQGFPPLQEHIWNRQMERQGSAKENAEIPALLFTADSSASVRVRMDAVLALIIGDTEPYLSAMQPSLRRQWKKRTAASSAAVP